MGNNNSHCDVANKKNKRMKTKEVVKELLINKPHLRDSDPKLIATYWYNELKKKQINPYKISGYSPRQFAPSRYEFMQLLANSKLTNIKTIERMRRKLQEEYPELRGRVYNNRKGVIQDQWKRELGYEVNQ